MHNDPAGARLRTAATIFVAQSCFSAATIAAFTLSPVIAPALSGSNASAGLPNTLGLVGKAAAALPIGYLMDRIGRRYSLGGSYLTGLLGAAISVIGVVQESIFFFLLGAAIIGLSRSGAELSRYVAAEVYPAGQRARILGIAVSAGTVGAVLGPLLVPPSQALALRLGLAENAGPFLAAGLLMGLAMLATLTFLRPDPRELARAVAAEEAAQETGPLLPERTLSEIMMQPAIWLAILAMSIGFLVMAMLMIMTPLHMSSVGHDSTAISRIIMAHTIGMFGFAFVTGALIDMFGRETMIVVGGLVLVLSCLLAPLSTAPLMLAIALFLLGLGWNFCFVAGSSLLSDQLRPTERGRVQGLAETIVSITSGAASLSTGAVFDSGGYGLGASLGLWFSLLLIGVVLLYQARRFVPRRVQG